jgi:uncharacterized protein YecE (DUF72 family)
MLFVGQPALQGDIARYAQSFNLLELLAEPGRLPKPAGLAKWVESVGDDFAFTLRLSPRVWDADRAELEHVLAYADRVREAVAARVCLLQTPASATPTSRNKQKLGALCRELERLGTTLAWEPRGVWEAEEMHAMSEALGVLLVRDLSREQETPVGSVVYTRLLALGEAGHVKSSAAHDVAELVAPCERAYVVLLGTGARRAAKIMRDIVDDLSSEAEED